MISNENYPAAHKALHELVIWARAMGYEKDSPTRIARLLDGVEYLIGMLYDEQESTEWFSQYLQGLTDDFGWPGIHERYVAAVNAATTEPAPH